MSWWQVMSTIMKNQRKVGDDISDWWQSLNIYDISKHQHRIRNQAMSCPWLSKGMHGAEALRARLWTSDWQERFVKVRSLAETLWLHLLLEVAAADVLVACL